VNVTGSASISGFSGSLRYGYQEAAALGPWSLKLAPRLPRRYDLSAAIASRHDYWITQRPLTLVLTVGPATWEWAGYDIVADGERIVVVGLGIPTIVNYAKLGRMA
jgi:hypothetical protein